MPNAALFALRVSRVKKEIARGEAGKEAQQAGKDDQTKIVLLGNAGIDNPQHGQHYAADLVNIR
jgi:hypothetical protein